MHPSSAHPDHQMEHGRHLTGVALVNNAEKSAKATGGKNWDRSFLCVPHFPSCLSLQCCEYITHAALCLPTDLQEGVVTRLARAVYLFFYMMSGCISRIFLMRDGSLWLHSWLILVYLGVACGNLRVSTRGLPSGLFRMPSQLHLWFAKWLVPLS